MDELVFIFSNCHFLCPCKSFYCFSFPAKCQISYIYSPIIVGCCLFADTSRRFVILMRAKETYILTPITKKENFLNCNSKTYWVHQRALSLEETKPQLYVPPLRGGHMCSQQALLGWPAKCWTLPWWNLTGEKVLRDWTTKRHSKCDLQITPKKNWSPPQADFLAERKGVKLSFSSLPRCSSCGLHPWRLSTWI